MQCHAYTSRRIYVGEIVCFIHCTDLGFLAKSRRPWNGVIMQAILAIQEF